MFPVQEFKHVAERHTARICPIFQWEPLGLVGQSRPIPSRTMRFYLEVVVSSSEEASLVARLTFAAYDWPCLIDNASRGDAYFPV